MEGILPKKIRARNDKGESFRINYSKYNIVSNSSYLCEVVESIPNDGTLKYFRKELLLKRLKETSDPDKLFRYCRDATIFLRHYNISKEYPKLHDRGYLHKRHRLSHRQIDSLLCKESGKSFLEEKLNSLMLVSEFISIVRILNSKSIFFISLKGPLLSQRIYSDATVRISHDIDLFIKKEDFDAVYELMLSNGYRLCSGEVWPEGRSGRRMILKSAYHLAFCKEGSKFMIEIHWQLIDYIHISRKKLSHIIEENVMELSFNGESVRCFSPEFELVYIMIHGSKHGWSRLKWIMDIKDYPTESLNIQKFTELLSLMKAQRVLTQTNFIMNRFFNTKLPIKESCKINSYLLNYPIGCINSVIPERYSVKDILKKFIYNFLLFPGIIYRIRLITSLILRSSDAENIDSNHLIFYYLYRPWSFIKRRIIND
jgi:hypothetical protein